MPSPFPGMDPYLEEPHRWGGVHLRLIVEISNELNRVLPDGLRAELDQYVRIEEEGHDGIRPSRRNPDVFVPAPRGPRRRHRNGSATATLDPPTLETVLLPGPVVKHRRILIQDRDGRRILTALELLSPSNKSPGKDREAYLAKRNQYLASGTNLVEIDLLRDGDRLPFGSPRPPVSDYYILVSPAETRPHLSVWAFSVRQAIPKFAVPIGAEFGSVPVDLNSCLRLVYDLGRYAQELDYSRPAEPPLDAPDAEWAANLNPKPSNKK